jgi:hypothetical protein
VVNLKNKEYHSNWSSVIEVKKSIQSDNIDNILNQNEEEDEGDVFGQIITNESKEKDKKVEEGDKKEEKNKISDKWKDEDEEEDDEEIKKMLEEAKKKRTS